MAQLSIAAAKFAAWGRNPEQHRTALITFADNPGIYWVVLIEEECGSDLKQVCKVAMSHKEARAIAEQWLNAEETHDKL